jgi:outer membrane receptor protein involved in Fe transport
MEFIKSIEGENMKKFSGVKWCLLMLLLGLAGSAGAQRPDGVPGLTLSGTVIDSVSQLPMEYATIILYSQSNHAQAGGTIADREGRFEISRLIPGPYQVKIDFIGYESRSFQDVVLTPRRLNTDLGRIFLKPAVLESHGVEVSAEKPTFEYKIDKKVINVSQQPTVISGTAVDVLENVPSITTDIDGNVQLRGSSNFTVLIDNRPSVLESNDALQQIPASIIESIEIITNPSAKFDPEGTAGIINVITKKNQKQGIAGIANANIGLNDQYGGDFLLSQRLQKFNVFFGADYNKRAHPRLMKTERQTFMGDTVRHTDSSGDGDWGNTGYGVRGGFDYTPTSRDLIGLNLRLGGRANEGQSSNHYTDWTDPGETVSNYSSGDESKRDGTFYSLNLDYKHEFPKKGHELLGSFMLSKRSGDEKSTNTLRDSSGLITQSQHFTEGGPSRMLRINVDYTLPLRQNDKLQAGFQSRIEPSEEEIERWDLNTATQEFELQPLYSHSVDYKDNIHAIYSMYAAELGALGAQIGLRGEYTDRKISLVKTGESYALDQWDFFPTLHISQQFAGGKQAMLSYTRRIERPHGWDLEPFETWMDAYNVRKGNPALKSEYIDSYELGFQTAWGRNLISLESYYRVTHNKTERVQSVYRDNITLQTIANVGHDYTFGTEMMTNVDLFKWWNLNLMGTLYHYEVSGELFGESFSRNSRNWNTRLNSTFKITGSTRLQLTGMYNSPSVSSQGRRESFSVLNLGLKQEFLERSLSATLQIRDLLKTGKFEFSSSGPDFSSHSRFRRSQEVMLTLTYNINNYKPDKKQNLQENNGNGEMQGGGEEEF